MAVREALAVAASTVVAGAEDDAGAGCLFTGIAAVEDLATDEAGAAAAADIGAVDSGFWPPVIVPIVVWSAASLKEPNKDTTIKICSKKIWIYVIIQLT